MAETALGMATTLVGSALGVASSAAKEETGLLLGVQDDIWYFLCYFFLHNNNTKAYSRVVRRLFLKI
jgi:disease resistance protein RPM1